MSQLLKSAYTIEEVATYLVREGFSQAELKVAIGEGSTARVIVTVAAVERPTLIVKESQQ